MSRRESEQYEEHKPRAASLHGQRRTHKRSKPIHLEPMVARHRVHYHHAGSRGNQRDEYDQDDHRSRRRYQYLEPHYPRMAMMYLPPLEYADQHEWADTGRAHVKQHHHRGRRRRRHSSSSSSSSSRSCSESENERRGFPTVSFRHAAQGRHPAVAETTTTGIRSQRVRSLQAMASLQRAAARVIQQEYRFYRNRCRNRTKQADRLSGQALEFLDTFLQNDIVPYLVSDALLEVLRDQAVEQALSDISGETALLSLAESVYDDVLGGLVHDTFQGVVDSMVRDYMITRLDHTRASQPPALAIATDLLDEWTRDLVADLTVDALSELVEDYMKRRRDDDLWAEMLCDELRDVLIDATVELKLDDTVKRLEGGLHCQ